MRVTFCGTGSGGVTALRATSCIHLSDGNSGLLLDCGPGTIQGLFRTGLALPKASALVLSHLHMDHCHGFPEWLAHLVFPFGVLPRVYGPRDTAEYIRRASYATQFVARTPTTHLDTPLNAEVTELGDGASLDMPGGVRLRSAVVPHVPELEAMAYRVEMDRRSVVYSGDTQAVPSTLVPLSEGAELLIHEAFSEAGLDDWLAGVDPVRAEPVRSAFRGTHTDVREAARIAQEAGVKRLVLTHLNPGEKPERLAREAATIFHGEILVADDGLALDL